MTTSNLNNDITVTTDSQGNQWVSSPVPGLALAVADIVKDFVLGEPTMGKEDNLVPLVARQEDWRDKLSDADLRLVDHTRKEEEALGVFDWCHNWAA